MSRPVEDRPIPDPAIRETPRLSVSREPRKAPSTHDPAGNHPFRYRARHHRNLPHVVKFSGGRSSGMLLFTLLENGLLDRGRGDVVIFNNTSAEHPGTYRFVRDCMRATRRYGIPFFQIEFQTYEDSRRGVYTRLPSYRMVNGRPADDGNPDGFSWRGEVFEELLSWAGYVPNQFNRICTKHLKLEATRDFLGDWLAGKSGIPRLGHHGGSSRVEADAAYERHCANRGTVPREIFLRKRAYAWNRPHFRAAQSYGAFCPDWTPFGNPALAGAVFGGRARFGEGGAEYVALIGLRGDEPHRVQRVASRDAATDGHEGEHIYMPLVDMGITKDDVNAFWDRQDWDLDLPRDISLSNCVYCFLKGAANLGSVHRAQRENGAVAPGFGPTAGTPGDLAWWQRIEREYGRDLRAEGREARSAVRRIGFFGNKKFSYESVTDDAAREAFAGAMLPCDCTE